MLFFLGICFLILTFFLCELKVSATAPKILSALYIVGMVLLDLAVLALMATIWAVDNGKL